MGSGGIGKGEGHARGHIGLADAGRTPNPSATSPSQRPSYSDVRSLRAPARRCARSKAGGPFPAVSRDPHRMPTGPSPRMPGRSRPSARRVGEAGYRLASDSARGSPCDRPHQGSPRSPRASRRRRAPIWGYVRAGCIAARGRVPRIRTPRPIRYRSFMMFKLTATLRTKGERRIPMSFMPPSRGSGTAFVRCYRALMH